LSDSPRVQIKSTDVSWREVDGDIVALDLRSSTYFTTNRTGAVMWNAMVDGCQVDDLVELLQSTFSISRASATHDVQAFLDVLRRNKLISVEG
jgi:hypothetical protein